MSKKTTTTTTNKCFVGNAYPSNGTISGTISGTIASMPSYVSSQSHALIGPNVHQWSAQDSMTALSGLRPVAAMPSMAQLTIGSNAMWSPVGNSYGFYSHRLTHLPPNGNHSMHSNNCCLASHNQRTHCQQYNDNSWTSNAHQFSNSNTNESHIKPNNNNNNDIIERITDLNIEDSENGSTHDRDDSEGQTSKPESEECLEMKQLKGINEVLKSSLEQTTLKLKETQNSLIKMNDKLAMDYIEKYRTNLKRYGDYIKEECTRFYQNEAIAKKLEPIVQQIRFASNKAKEERERIRDAMTASQTHLNQQINANHEVSPFDYNCLPEFPDLLSFYKNILDEIPLVFLADLSQLKKFTNIYIKNKVDSEECLPNVGRLSDFNQYPTVPLISAPKIADLPKPDFSLFGAQETGFNFQLRTDEDMVSQSATELPFPKSSSPIPVLMPLFNQLSNSIINDDNSSTLKPFVDKSNEKPISPIGKPIQTQPIIELKTVSHHNKVVNDFEVNSHGLVAKRPELGPKQTSNNQKRSATLDEMSGSESNVSKLSQAQTKLLAKLKEKYIDLSDDLLIDSITQTKSRLIACGNPKGFSGMKVSDIISKISEYIDKHVISMPNAPKIRNSRPTLSLKLNSNQNDNNSSQQMMPKGWANQMDRKRVKNDDNCCSICFESISLNTKYETECHHFFHDSCISNWIKKDGSCPICRSLVLPPGEYPEL